MPVCRSRKPKQERRGARLQCAVDRRFCQHVPRTTSPSTPLAALPSPYHPGPEWMMRDLGGVSLLSLPSQCPTTQAQAWRHKPCRAIAYRSYSQDALHVSVLSARWRSLSPSQLVTYGQRFMYPYLSCSRHLPQGLDFRSPLTSLSLDFRST